ncbi:GIP [Symbiodinium sp. CCMP2592]|nr:GIP [Symbiodinium sp. CCMP2592]
MSPKSMETPRELRVDEQVLEPTYEGALALGPSGRPAASTVLEAMDVVETVGEGPGAEEAAVAADEPAAGSPMRLSTSLSSMERGRTAARDGRRRAPSTASGGTTDARLDRLTGLVEAMLVRMDDDRRSHVSHTTRASRASTARMPEPLGSWGGFGIGFRGFPGTQGPFPSQPSWVPAGWIPNVAPGYEIPALAASAGPATAAEPLSQSGAVHTQVLGAAGFPRAADAQVPGATGFPPGAVNAQVKGAAGFPPGAVHAQVPGAAGFPPSAENAQVPGATGFPPGAENAQVPGAAGFPPGAVNAQVPGAAGFPPGAENTPVSSATGFPSGAENAQASSAAGFPPGAENARVSSVTGFPPGVRSFLLSNAERLSPKQFFIGDSPGDLPPGLGPILTPAPVVPLPLARPLGSKTILTRVSEHYASWLASDPVTRLTIRTQAIADGAVASAQPGTSLLEQRLTTLLVDAVPSAMKTEVITVRALTTVEILFLLHTRYQPAGQAEKASILQFLVSPDPPKDAQAAVKSLRRWLRWLARSTELQLAPPDASLLVKAVDKLGSAYLSDPSAVFRVQAFRLQHSVDHLPSQDSSVSLAQLYLAELETLLLVAPDPKKQRVAALDSSAADKPEETKGKGKGREKGAKPNEGGEKEVCRQFSSEKGCPRGNTCKYVHQTHTGMTGRCFNCGGKHLKSECTSPGGYAVAKAKAEAKADSKRAARKAHVEQPSSSAGEPANEEAESSGPALGPSTAQAIGKGLIDGGATCCLRAAKNAFEWNEACQLITEIEHSKRVTQARVSPCTKAVPSNRRRRRTLSRANHLVIHLFPGQSRGLYLSWDVLEVDVEEDLLREDTFGYLMHLAQAGRIRAVIGGPPYRTFSTPLTTSALVPLRFVGSGARLKVPPSSRLTKAHLDMYIASPPHLLLLVRVGRYNPDRVSSPPDALQPVSDAKWDLSLLESPALEFSFESLFGDDCEVDDDLLPGIEVPDVPGSEDPLSASQVAEADAENKEWLDQFAALEDAWKDAPLPAVPMQDIPFFVPLETKGGKGVAAAVMQVVTQIKALGLPVHRLHSDRGREFRNAALAQFTKFHCIPHTTTCGDDFKANGRTENMVRLIKRATRTLLHAHDAPTAEWSFAMRHVTARLRAAALSTLGHASPKLLPWHARLVLRRRTWSRLVTGAWGSRAITATVLCPSPDVPGGHLVRTADGGYVHSDVLVEVGDAVELQEFVCRPPATRLRDKKPDLRSHAPLPAVSAVAAQRRGGGCDSDSASGFSSKTANCDGGGISSFSSETDNSAKGQPTANCTGGPISSFSAERFRSVQSAAERSYSAGLRSEASL